MDDSVKGFKCQESVVVEVSKSRLEINQKGL